MTTTERIFSLLKERGITQFTFSKDIGLSSGNISDWKSGRSAPKVEAVKRIAEYFGVSSDYLLGLSENKQPAAMAGDGLSEAERSLIELYRLLTPEQKDMVDQVARTAAAAQRSSPKP